MEFSLCDDALHLVGAVGIAPMAATAALEALSFLCGVGFPLAQPAVLLKDLLLWLSRELVLRDDRVRLFALRRHGADGSRPPIALVVQRVDLLARFQALEGQHNKIRLIWVFGGPADAVCSF
jgi:hypothetical protein